MPVARIPLVIGYNSRKDAATTVLENKDQFLKNCMFKVGVNPVTNESFASIEKRIGFTLHSEFNPISGTGNGSLVFVSNRTGVNPNQTFVCKGSVSTVNGSSHGNLGSVDSGVIYHATETIQNGESFVVFTTSLGTAYYHAQSMGAVTSVTGTTTNGSAVVTGVSSTTGLYSGQPISGTGIPSSTRILSVDSSSQITMDANATASGAITITVTRLAKIIDADFPTALNINETQGKMVFMDGYAFVITRKAEIHNSALNDFTSWAASDYLTANEVTDNGVTLARYKNLIAAFGTKSIEFFQNAGSAFGSPLVRVSGSTIKIGAASGVAVVESEDTIYWVGTSDTRYAGIFRLNGLQPEKISSPIVDELIQSAGLAAVRISVAQVANSHLVFVDLAGAFLLVLDTNTGIWSEWTTPTNEGGFVNVTYKTGSAVFALFKSATRLHRLLFQDTTYVDNSSAAANLTYSAIAQTQRHAHGTNNRKFVKSVSLVSDKQSSGTATLEYSDDDYGSWTTAGTFDLTKMNPRIHRCGSFVGGRAWRVTHSANTAFRADALEVDLEVGVH